MKSTKFTNLEAHSGRNNLVFFGLEEVTGLETGNPDKMINEILRYILDLEDGDPTPEVERQHHGLRPRLAPTEPLCPYIVRMLRWSDRQTILGAVAKKKILSWREGLFRVYQDLPTEVRKKRTE